MGKSSGKIVAFKTAEANRPALRVISPQAELPSLVQPLATSDPAALACGLYHATLALLHASDDPVRHSHRLASPLGQLVARQRTRVGQKDCAQFAEALLAGDHEAALEACRRLIASAGNTSA